jgi:hypothetical protein
MRYIKLFEQFNKYETFLSKYGLDYNSILSIIEEEGDLQWIDPKECLDDKLDYLMDISSNDSDIQLYRIVFCKDKNYIDIKNLGNCFVSDIDDFHDDMLNYLYHNAKKLNKKLKETDSFLVTIKTNTKYVDIKSTLETFIEHPNENEITVFDNMIFEIIDIEKY